MRADRRRRRKSGAKIRIKLAGPRALQIFLENQLHGLVIARERISAIIGTNQALGRRGFGTISAERATAISADAHGFGIMRGAFHFMEFGVKLFLFQIFKVKFLFLGMNLAEQFVFQQF